MFAIDKTGLNKPQLAAVEQIDGPMVIYAGAGSGKTRVICYRIANLIANGVSPSSILAVTFTNKAAKEMRERIEQLIGLRARSIIVSTFHSACARFLRIYAKEAGYTESFSIYDDGDQKSLLKDVVKELNIPEKFLTVATIKNKIDRLKNAGETPQDYKVRIRRESTEKANVVSSSFVRFGEEEHAEIIQKCYELYQSKLKQQNAMDFNDLILVMVEMLSKREDVLKQMHNRFRYFLVDEFQDTNPTQFKFIELLSAHTKNLCIVGDDDQSIYSWRGAEPAFILDFNKQYPNANVFKLEQNYRSSETIVKAATSIISNNLKRAPKTLWTSQTSGSKILIKTASDPYDEAQFIVNGILNTLKEGARLREFAILYRTNAQSRALEDELRRRMLPYIIYGSVRFYERAEIKILLSYLRLLINPDDDAAFVRMIAVPRRGFGDKAISRLKELAYQNNLSLARAADRIANNEIVTDIGRGLSALKEVSKLFTRCYSSLKVSGKPSIVLDEILTSIHFSDYLRTVYPEDSDDRWLNVLELKNALIEFEGRFETTVQHQKDTGEVDETFVTSNGNMLAAFLEQALLTVEPTVHNVQAGETDAVSLMTIHSSKGLEFDRVFIAGLEEGVLPHMNSLEVAASVEEERRLMYVAVTRARQHLTLTHIRRNRFRPDIFAETSRFIKEVPIECADFIKPASSTTPLTNVRSNLNLTLSSSLKSADSILGAPLATTIQNETDPSFQEGQRVRHKLFGVGTIQRIEKCLSGFKLEIRFPVVGVKKLMHTYVTLA